jgi:hypothetical protein
MLEWNLAVKEGAEKSEDGDNKGWIHVAQALKETTKSGFRTSNSVQTWLARNATKT